MGTCKYEKKALLFACIEKNIGDDLFVYLVCNRYTNVQFYITSDANYGTLSKIQNLKFDYALKKWLWASSIGTNSRAKFLVGRILQYMYSLFIEHFDVGIYIVGNAFKNPNYSGSNQILWLKRRINLVDRFYIISTNFGPFNNKKWIEDCRNVFSKAEDICFRDEESYDYFSKLPNVRYARDAVFSLGKQISSKEKNIIVSVVDFSFEGRNDLLKSKTQEFENRIADIASKYANEGYQITFLNSNTKQDLPACSRIIDKIENKNMIHTINYNGDLDEVFEIYKKSCFVIGTRLHTIILSLLYDIPVLPIIYDIKVENVLSSVGFTGEKIYLEKIYELTFSKAQKALSEYSFCLSQRDICDSASQFKKIDKEFSM